MNCWLSWNTHERNRIQPVGLLSHWQCLAPPKTNNNNKDRWNELCSQERCSALKMVKSFFIVVMLKTTKSFSTKIRFTKDQKMFKVQINVRRAHFPPVDIHPIRTTLMGHKLQESFHLILTQKDLLKFLCHGTKNLSQKINPQPTCQKRLSRSRNLTYGGAKNLSLSQKISWRNSWCFLLMTNQQKWRMSSARKSKMRKTQLRMKARQEETKNWTILLCPWSRLQAFCSTFVKL